jgi:hypothetical protein
MGSKPFILIIKELKSIISLLGRIKMNNTLRVFEEAFIQLKRYTKYTSLMKLRNETGEPHTRSRSPRRAKAVGLTCPFLLSICPFTIRYSLIPLCFAAFCHSHHLHRAHVSVTCPFFLSICPFTIRYSLIPLCFAAFCIPITSPCDTVPARVGLRSLDHR